MVRRPATTSLAAGKVSIEFTRLKEPVKPILVRTIQSQSKLTLSKAFSTSRVIIAKSFPGLHLACSKTVITLGIFNVAVFPFTKLTGLDVSERG